VGLQKERIDPKIIEVKLDTKGDFEQAQIAPLLLLPLAENCFKHGIGKNPGTISIAIGYEKGVLIFKTKNVVAPREKSDKENIGGLGIRNVKKRLNLIYPKQHSIDYQEVNGIFKLEMKIELTTI
jgi:sensor histidine kinase YesM